MSDRRGTGKTGMSYVNMLSQQGLGAPNKSKFNHSIYSKPLLSSSEYFLKQRCSWKRNKMGQNLLMVILLMGKLCHPQVKARKVCFHRCSIFLYYDGYLVILFHLRIYIYLHASEVNCNIYTTPWGISSWWQKWWESLFMAAICLTHSVIPITD